MSESKPFYITTPIYFSSDKLHVGHTYTTVAADAMSRYKRMQGFDVMFVTGTDEHGQKIQGKAQEAKVSPKAYVDHIAEGIKALWQTMDITYDRFIRTTDDYHMAAVQDIFQKLYEQGDIYKGEYKGLYCAPCESFWTATQLVDNKCPDCGRAVEETAEEAYFFKLSNYQKPLMAHLEANPGFLEPNSRVKEMIQNFLEPGLDDLCVSRTSFDWGVPVSFDPGHVVYVWIDALSNYINVLGYPDQNQPDFIKYWPADIHLVGKEIVRFHAIIWPAMLMALKLPLPKKIFGHGWLLLDGDKMSKSKGNVVDPVILCQRYGVDALRYFLMREVQFGSDGAFSTETFLQRINTDLCNDLGNLVSRTAAMAEKYFSGKLPQERLGEEVDHGFISTITSMASKVEMNFEQLHFSVVLGEIWQGISRCNKYIDETMPWVLAKEEKNNPRLGMVLYNLVESLRIISILIEPFMPNTPKLIRQSLGIADPGLMTWESSHTFGLYPVESIITKMDNLFPRIDIPEEMKLLESLSSNSPETKSPVEDKGSRNCINSTQEKSIQWEDFEKIQLVAGKVLTCEKVEGADRLLKSTVDIGSEIRTILSGIALTYQPEQVVGKMVTVVANLAPKKIRKIESHGMLLCGTRENQHVLILAEGCKPGDVIA